MKKKLAFVFVVFCIGLGLFSKNPSSLEVITHEILTPDILHELQYNNLFNLRKIDTDIYVSNFTQTDLPEVKHNNHRKIFWMGGMNNDISEQFSKFDIIFTSNPYIMQMVRHAHSHVFWVPLFDSDIGNITYNKNGKIGLIGNPPYIENLLSKHHIDFEKFSLDDTQKIYDNLGKLKVVFIDNTALTQNSIELNPIFLKIARVGIPIIAHRNYLYTDAILIFNDMVSYYDTEQEIDLKSILDFDEEIEKKRLKAQEFSKTYFSKKAILDRIEAILEKKDIDIPPLHKSVNLHIPTTFGNYNGDYNLGKDLKNGLEELNYVPELHFFTSYFIKPSEINIVIPPLFPIDHKFLNSSLNIMYYLYPIYPIHDNDDMSVFKYSNSIESFVEEFIDDFKATDVVVFASQKMAHEVQKHKIKSFYIPQFTNPKRFYPDYDTDKQSEILFVGSSHYYRKAPEIALKHNFPINIYGPVWPDNIRKGERINNNIIRKYYSSAKINLNDTMDAMKKFGFISNRVFDVTASGGFLISDYMPEIEEIYGDSIPMWKTEEELVELLNYYLDPAHEEERLEKAARAREITLKNFTSDIVAEKFDEIIKELKKEKGIE